MNLPLKMEILKRFPSQADFADAVGSRESIVSRVIPRPSKTICRSSKTLGRYFVMQA